MRNSIRNVLLKIAKSSKRFFQNKKDICSERIRLSFLILFILCTVNSVLHHCKNTAISEDLDSNEKDMKYILKWVMTQINSPFEFLEEGDVAFVRNKCTYTNCYITKDKHYFFSVEDFDAIVFNGVDLFNRDHNTSPKSLPQSRSAKQKYIFGAMEPAGQYPVCDKRFDGFFNWTWTYRLDSDFRWGYIAIYDLKHDIVGPDVDMEWVSDMTPVPDRLKLQLSNKTKAAAWFVSNCKTKGRREQFVRRLRKELSKFGLAIDIFGKCGAHSCPKTAYSKCSKVLQDRYFFYFAFENCFARDYVTEKLTRALNSYTVPVVYGGANYSRFVPVGSYLDARKLGPKSLALKMKQLINNKTAYYDFFRWRNHYAYESRGRNDVCKLCAMLNDREKVSATTVWSDFRNWWNEKSACDYLS